MLQGSNLIVPNKTDLPYVDCVAERSSAKACALDPIVKAMRRSAKTGEALGRWCGRFGRRMSEATALAFASVDAASSGMSRP